MRVLMAPHEALNPYQHELATALATQSIATDFTNLRWRLPLAGPDAPEILHLHWLHKNTATTPLRFWLGSRYFEHNLRGYQRRGGRVLWTVHNLKDHEGRHADREQQLGRRVGRVADAVIVHSESALPQVIASFNLPPEKVHLVPHPAYSFVAADVPSRAAAREALQIPSTQMLFAFVGAVRPYKGVEELIAAFTDLPDADARLAIAGKAFDPEYAQRISDLTAGDARIDLRLGHLAEDEMVRLLAAADAIVLPYRSILTSGALVLAMGVGRACVAPRFGVFAEHLEARGGILYPPDDPDGLRAALTEATRRRGELDTLGAANRALTQQWGPEQVGAALANVIRQVRAQ